MNFKNRRNNKKPRGLKGEVLLQSTCIQFLCIKHEYKGEKNEQMGF